MDKRTIFFLLGMTLIFFLMHQWFDVAPQSQAQPIDPPKTELLFTDKGTPTLLTKEEMEKIGIAEIFSDIQLKNFLGYAIVQDTAYLTLAPDNYNWPKQVYAANKSGSFDSPVRLEQRVAAKRPGALLFYSIHPLSKVKIPWIPDEGNYLVDLIYFVDRDLYRIRGRTFGTEKAIFEALPPKNSLALFHFGGSIDPYGVFDIEEKKLLYLDDMDKLEDFTVVSYLSNESLQKQLKEQDYYLLENEWMQLVFSNVNGALVEINLPFHSASHPKSVIQKIEFDRIMATDYPNNNQFPQYKALGFDSQGKKKEINPQMGSYYPLLRRNIIASAGNSPTVISPYYYAFSISERDQAPETQLYTVTRFEKDLIEFTWSDEKRTITKVFSLPKDDKDAPYCLDLSLRIEGDTRGLNLSMGVPEVELVSGSFTPTLQYRITQNQKTTVKKIKVPKDVVTYDFVKPDWYSNGNGFFGIILDPLTVKLSGFSAEPISGELVPSRLSMIDAHYQRFPPSKYPGYTIETPLATRNVETQYRIFAGPFDKKILAKVDQTFTDPVTGYSPDYLAAQHYHGWFAFISQPFAKFLGFILDFFYNVTHSWGFSIILLTLSLRLMLYPLNNWSMKSTAKLKQIAPKVKAVQEKYKKDPKRSQLELMNLYKREKANPFGGCLPLIIQLPFLFGMFDLLKSSFSLRGASFIPGWIDNLTAPDVLFSWGYPIPFIGTSFHLLPFILGGTMFIQQRFMSIGTAKKAETDQEKQQRSMGNIMTVIFTIFFYHFPSGLNLYWISSMLLGILQQFWVNKQIDTNKR